jgi:hypothetical protein
MFGHWCPPFKQNMTPAAKGGCKEFEIKWNVEAGCRQIEISGMMTSAMSQCFANQQSKSKSIVTG